MSLARLSDPSCRDVLVVGSGISGMGTAHLLARMGYQVYLLDSAPGIGGSFHLLDRTFSTNYCGICIMLPEQPSYCPTLEADTNPNIHILALTELKALEGKAGAFNAKVLRKPRYVDIERCNRCGKCREVCPESRPSVFEGSIALQQAIYPPPSRAVPDAFVIDMDVCTRCGKCVEVCPENAIDLDMHTIKTDIQVGAVVLSPGFEPFNVEKRSEFGWGHYPNVLTSIQFERMASIAGSTRARLTRPSDGMTPEKIAFIHCVGSRDREKGNEFCSSACCMYTAKQITMAKENYPDLEVTVFTMDIRAFGKGFEHYMDDVMAKPGITYRRSMVSSVYQYEKTKDLYVKYLNDQGEHVQEDFDMIVLAVGLDHPKGAEALSHAAGIELNQWLFAKTGPFSTRGTTRPGVFIGGAFHEPMDIPEVIADSSAAASAVAGMLGLPENLPSKTEKTLESDERDVTGEDPRLGVFICRCRDTMTEAIDLDKAEAYTRKIDIVSHTEVLDDLCTPEGLAAMREIIRKQELNRVVVAGCTHRLHGKEFASMMRSAGLNPSLLERANIREGAAWAFQGDSIESPGDSGFSGDPATGAAQSLIEIASAKAYHHEAVSTETYRLYPKVLILGGGVTGMTSAVALSDMGVAVDLVEREDRLGGNLLTSYYTIDGGDIQCILRELHEKVTKAENVTMYPGTELSGFAGSVGNFTAELTGPGGKTTSNTYGAVILATGGKGAPTTEYLYGSSSRVMTQKDLEKTLAQGNSDPAWNTVVMIQCVGSRDEHHPWCSRVCCSHAVKNALKLKEISPETAVYVLYREARTYGFMEAAYQKAREAGVVFMRYELPDKPELEEPAEGPIRIITTEPIIRETVTLQADLVVVSTGIEPRDNTGLAEFMDLPLDEDGFFRETNPKMRPMDFTRAGIFMAGLAHSPRHIFESITQAEGAAVRAAALLARRELTAKSTRAYMNPRQCRFCGLCVENCPYGARVIEEDKRVSGVVASLCQGCGVCAMVCPNKATQQSTFSHKQIMAAIDAAVE